MQGINIKVKKTLINWKVLVLKYIVRQFIHTDRTNSAILPLSHTAVPVRQIGFGELKMLGNELEYPISFLTNVIELKNSMPTYMYSK